MTAGLVAVLFEDLVERHGAAIGTIRGHGVEGVGDGNDSGQPRDLVAGKPIRVTGTVPVLVVAADDRDETVQLGNGLDDGGALERMRLHLLELLAREPTGLAEE